DMERTGIAPAGEGEMKGGEEPPGIPGLAPWAIDIPPLRGWRTSPLRPTGRSAVGYSSRRARPVSKYFGPVENSGKYFTFLSSSSSSNAWPFAPLAAGSLAANIRSSRNSLQDFRTVSRNTSRLGLSVRRNFAGSIKAYAAL